MTTTSIAIHARLGRMHAQNRPAFPFSVVPRSRSSAHATLRPRRASGSALDCWSLVVTVAVKLQRLRVARRGCRFWNTRFRSTPPLATTQFDSPDRDQLPCYTREAAVGALAVGGGWWLAVGGGWWLAAGGWRLVVGGWLRLAVDGSWRLAVGGPLGRSLRAVLSKTKKKTWSLQDRPGEALKATTTKGNLADLPLTRSEQTRPYTGQGLNQQPYRGSASKIRPQRRQPSAALQ